MDLEILRLLVDKLFLKSLIFHLFSSLLMIRITPYIIDDLTCGSFDSRSIEDDFPQEHQNILSQMSALFFFDLLSMNSFLCFLFLDLLFLLFAWRIDLFLLVGLNLVYLIIIFGSWAILWHGWIKHLLGWVLIN